MSDTPRTFCVLVVDDNLDTVETTATLLELYGFRALTALGGNAALRIAATEHPDVVVTDLAMPDGNGHELARHLRAEVSPCPVLIALTGRVTAADREQSKAAGFDMHLAKPLEPDHLLELLQRFIQLALLHPVPNMDGLPPQT